MNVSNTVIPDPSLKFLEHSCKDFVPMLFLFFRGQDVVTTFNNSLFLTRGVHTDRVNVVIWDMKVGKFVSAVRKLVGRTIKTQLKIRRVEHVG